MASDFRYGYLETPAMDYDPPMATKPDLAMDTGPVAPAEPCSVCDRLTPTNVAFFVGPRGREAEEFLRRGVACDVCLAHYRLDGLGVQLWPDLCTWTPEAVLEDCDCETCTGQIEFRINAGTDFYD